MSERRSLTVEERHERLVDGIQRGSAEAEYYPYIDSKSAVYRYLIDAGARAVLGREDVDEVDDEALDPDNLSALIPRHEVAKYLRDQIKNEGRPEILSSDVAGRWERHAEKLFDGNFKPSIQKVETQAAQYIDEVEMFAETGYLSPSEAQRQAEAIWSEVDRYRDMAVDAEHAPDVREVPDEVRLGRGLRRLQEDAEGFLASATELAGAEHLNDTDALMQALASEHGVEVAVVETVLDELTEDGLESSQALKSTHADELPGPSDLLDDPALDAGTEAGEAAADGGEAVEDVETERVDDTPPDRFDDRTETMQIRPTEAEAEALEGDD